MIEGRLWTDPQEGRGHYCAVCGREMFGESEICQRCTDRLVEDEEEGE